jgi:twitching motility protein PilT
VLVTGRTGSGKTTTLASLIQEINRTRQEHIITIEDPIEYVHNPDKCIISQREVGVHVDSFKNGLKYALRQDPNIILIGEIRDKETAHLTLEATATGHLVFATLHTMSAVESVRRYVNFFDTEEQNNIRNLLASNLAYVLSQQLIPHQRGIGRTMAMEVMNVRDSDSIKALLRDGKDYQIPSYMHQKLGMITMDERLKQLEAMGKIPAGSSIFYAHRPKDVAESYKK